MQDAAELLSLALTFPTIVMAILVLREWYKSARQSMRTEVSDRTPSEWFIIGVTIGFAGSIADNLYWSIPWTASFLGHEQTENLVNAGVFFNIPFRQIAGTVAAYCHVRAATLERAKMRRKLDRLLVASVVTGILYSISLVCIR